MAMHNIRKFNQFCLELASIDAFFCLTALTFAFIGNTQNLIPKNQHFVSVRFEMFIEVLMKSFLVEAMSIITWKALRYIDRENTQRKVPALIGLIVIHVTWIFCTNLCYVCMLTKLETIVSLVELFTLLVTGAFGLRCVITVLNNIWLHFTGVMTTQDTSSSSKISNLSNPVYATTHNIGQDLPLTNLYSSTSWYPINKQKNNGESHGEHANTQMISQVRTPISHGSVSRNIGSLSTRSGIRYCGHHHPEKSPVTTLRNMDSPTSSHQAKSNNSRQMIRSSPPNEGSLLNSEFDIFESKTRRGTIYNKVKVNRSSGLITKD